MPESQKTKAGPSDTGYDVFISYARADEDHVRPAVGAMREIGLRLFFSAEDMKWGQDFYLSINDALNASRGAVLFLSENWAKSKWCEDELQAVMCKGERLILPVRLDDSPVPAVLEHLFAVDLRKLTPCELAERAKQALDERDEACGRTLGALSDDELARRVRLERDQEAFRVIFERYYPDMLRLALMRGANREEAEDVANTTLLRCWEGIGRYDPSKAPLNAWIRTIAYHTLMDRRRHLRASPDHLSLDSLDSMQQPTEPSNQALQAKILSAIESLSPLEREIIKISFLEGVSIKDTAARLNMSQASMTAHFHRAVRRLRNILVHGEAKYGIR